MGSKEIDIKARGLAEELVLIEQKWAIKPLYFPTRLSYRHSLEEALTRSFAHPLSTKQIPFEAAAQGSSGKPKSVLSRLKVFYGIIMEEGIFGLCHPDTSFALESHFFITYRSEILERFRQGKTNALSAEEFDQWRQFLNMPEIPTITPFRIPGREHLRLIRPNGLRI